MMSIKIVQFSRHPTPLVHLNLKSFFPFYLGRPISTDPRTPPPLQTIFSSLIFNISSLILSGFLWTFFHLAETVLSAFSWLYTLVCAVVQKCHEMSFIYSYSHFWCLFLQCIVFIKGWLRCLTS